MGIKNHVGLIRARERLSVFVAKPCITSPEQDEFGGKTRLGTLLKSGKTGECSFLAIACPQLAMGSLTLSRSAVFLDESFVKAGESLQEGSSTAYPQFFHRFRRSLM
jgi:hypothetical protein